MTVELIQNVEEECLEAPKYTCALGGALSVAANTYRIIPIIHAGSGCGMNQLVWFRESAGHQGVGYIGGLITPSSNVTEKEVVFGGEDRLREQIKATLDLIDGDLYIVLTGCIPSMIGDDVEAVVREFQDQGYPVLHANTSGFSGSNFKGYDAFFEAIIDQLLESQQKVKGLVNLFGVVPYQDLFWRGNIRRITGLLEKLGFTVNQVLGDYGGIESLKRLSAAEYSLVISPWVGISSAEKLKEKFGTPYVSYPNLPVGPRESSDFLREVGKKFNIPVDLIEKVIDEEEKRAYLDLDIIGDATTMFSSALPFAIVANSSTAIGITKFLTNEAGFTPTVVVINDNPPLETKKIIEQSLSELESGITPKIIFEVDSYRIRQLLKKSDFRLLLASSSEKYFAEELKVYHLSVAHPANDRLIVNATYTGYEGGISLLEDVMNKFVMPY